MACLDTSCLLDLLGRGGPELSRRAYKAIDQLGESEEELTTTLFSVGELYVGVHRSSKPDIERENVEALLEGIAVLPFDERSARTFGMISAHLFSIGKPAGDLDVLIAAVAIINGHSILTRNERHFRNITDLAVITY